MRISEDLLEQVCTTDCPRYAAVTCPFHREEKDHCPRVRKYAQSVYDKIGCKVPPEEILEDAKLSYLTWKHVLVKEISEEAFDDCMRILSNSPDGVKNHYICKQIENPFYSTLTKLIRHPFGGALIYESPNCLVFLHRGDRRVSRWSGFALDQAVINFGSAFSDFGYGCHLCF